MTPEMFTDKMKAIINDSKNEIVFDEEVAHARMDDLMCEVLVELGYEEGVRIFEETSKYYS